MENSLRKECSINQKYTVPCYLKKIVLLGITCFLITATVVPPVLSESVAPFNDKTPPEWDNQSQNKDSVQPGGKIVLSARGRDDYALNYAYLCTNENGEWKNYTHLTDWNYSRQFIIPRIDSEVDPYPDIDALYDFPVRIVLSDKTVYFSQPDLDDILFMDQGNTTQFPHSINIDESGKACVWVTIPKVHTRRSTVFYMYYGNSECDNQQNPEAVWNEEYALVYHMDGEHWTDLKDSTINGLDITGAYGENPVMYNQSGIMGNCVEFDMTFHNGSHNGSYLQCRDFTLPEDTSYTISAWVYRNTDYYSLFLFSTNDVATAAVRSRRNTGWPPKALWSFYTHTQEEGIVKLNSNIVTRELQWDHVVLQYDNTTGRVELFDDGNSVSRWHVGHTVAVENGINIGTNWDNANHFGRYMDGKIDEFRISKTVRHPLWIKAEAQPNLVIHGPEMNGGKGVPGKYDSPQKLQEDSTWQWTNFTWSSTQVPPGKTVGWKIVYVDTEGNQISTNTMSFTVRESRPDLDGEGSIRHSDITPGDTLEDRFYIINNGEIGSSLSWRIDTYPEWGNWTFTPENGADLTLKDGVKPINVTLTVPDKKNTTFQGKITVVNTENTDDHICIPVSVVTADSHSSSESSIFSNLQTFHQMLHRFLDHHPLLSQLLSIIFGILQRGDTK